MNTRKKVKRKTRKAPNSVNGHYYGIPEKAQEEINKKKRPPKKKKVRPTKRKMYA